MRRLLLTALLLAPTTAFAQDWSYREEMDALMFIQSFYVPALVEVCDEVFPEEAGTQSEAWAAWEKANKRSVHRGEKAYAKIEKSDDPVAEAREMAVEEAKEFRAKPPTSQRETCDKILEVLRRES